MIRVEKPGAKLMLAAALCQAWGAASAGGGALQKAAPGGNVLANGVAVGNACGQAVNQTLVFSQDTTADLYHPFLGYGVNMQNPLDAATAAKAVPDIQSLNFKFVKTEMGTPYKGDSFSTYTILPAPIGLPDDAAMYAQIADPIKSFYPSYTLDFMRDMRNAGIKFVSAMYAAPNSYVLPDGNGNATIIDANIPDFAKFYAAYLHALADLGIVPDYAETENEPNGNWSTGWTTDQFARMLTSLQYDMFYVNNGVPANLVASGTSTFVHFAMDYLNAIKGTAATYIDPSTNLPYPRVGTGGLKALTLHTYYVVQNPNNGGVPPADDPDFYNFYQQAKAAGIPLIVSEFGGTNYKSKSNDPNLENVNPAEEMKAALDLARRGANAALVWNLYPNTKDDVTYKTWALIDERGPTNAYWPFKALSPAIPDGSAVLAMQKSTVKPAINSLGYAAFQKGNVVVVGLANPSPQDLQVSMDIASASGYLVTKLASFTPGGLLESVPTGLVRGRCAMTVGLPGDPAGVAAGTGVVISVLLKPRITTQPAAFTSVNAGTRVTLSVAATQDASIKYQWQKNGKAIAGATASSLSFAANGVSGSQQTFTVVVSNNAGSATSDPAVVQIQ